MKKIILIVLMSLASVGCGNTRRFDPSPGDSPNAADETPIVARYEGGVISRREADRAFALRPGNPDDASVAERLEQAARDLAWRRMLVEKHRASIEADPRWTFQQKNLERRLAVKIVELHLTEEATVDDAFVEKIVQDRIKKLEDAVSLRVRHIYVRADRTMDANEKEESRDRIEDLARRIRNGENFAELAGAYSDSETAANGGLIPGLTRGFSHPAFERAAFALKPGEVSDIVETPNGYHIIKLEERFEPKEPDFEKIAAWVRGEQLRVSTAALRDELIKKLRSTVEVEKLWDSDGLHPDPETGALLKVQGLVVTTADELESVFPGFRLRTDLAIDQLAALRDAELLRLEAERRGWIEQPSTALEQATEESIEHFAMTSEFESIVDAIPTADLEEFARRHPRHLERPATVDVRIIFLPFPEKGDPYDVFLVAEDLVKQARAGADFAVLARDQSAIAADHGGYLGEIKIRDLAAYGMEFVRTVTSLRPSEISDPVRVTGRKVGGGPKTLKNGFLIVRIEDRRPQKMLSMPEDEEEVRRIYGKVHRDQLLAADRDSLLKAAGFTWVGNL